MLWAPAPRSWGQGVEWGRDTLRSNSGIQRVGVGEELSPIGAGNKGECKCKEWTPRSPVWSWDSGPKKSRFPWSRSPRFSLCLFNKSLDPRCFSP